jgi:hypothetical protein
VNHVFPCSRCFLLPADPNDPNPRHRSGVCLCWPTPWEAAQRRAAARRRFEGRWDDRTGWWTAA